MSDNTTLSPGTGGDVIASDDVGGVKFQRVKLALGADGVNDGDVALANPMPVTLREQPTYICNSGPITGATATGTDSISYLFHPSSETAKRYEILRVNVNQIAGVGGAQRIELRRITAENGTPGGSLGTPLGKNPANASSNAIFRGGATGAPTRATGVYLGCDVPVNANGNFQIPFNAAPSAIEADEFTARASQAEGWELVQEVTSTITTAPVFNVTWEWMEIG